MISVVVLYDIVYCVPSAGGMITTRETIKSSCRFTVATKKLNSFWEYRTRIGRRLKPNHPISAFDGPEGLVIPPFRQSGVAPKNKNAGFDASAMHIIPVYDRGPLNKARHRPFQPSRTRVEGGNFVTSPIQVIRRKIKYSLCAVTALFATVGSRRRQSTTHRLSKISSRSLFLFDAWAAFTPHGPSCITPEVGSVII